MNLTQDCNSKPPMLDSPRGSAKDKFSLMLHDRVVDLERAVYDRLLPCAPDARVRLLGCRTTSESGGVFVRARGAWNVDLREWAGQVLAVLGRRECVRWEVWCCQHWSFGFATECPYVIEALIGRSGGPEDVTRVAHAALDALQHCLKPVGLHHSALVEACATWCPAWFARSIKVAAADRQALYAWDPVTRTVAADGEEEEPEGPRERAAWTMLHGWLASQMEVTDVWHPRSLNSAVAGATLVEALGRLVQDEGA